jgi:hypothetical protein
VLRRHFMGERLARVWAARVVSDDERGLLLFIADGSPWQDLVTVDGRTPRQVPFREWVAAEKRLDLRTWQDSVLMWHGSGEPYSIWLFFDRGGAFRGWYANLELPGVRWRQGIDTVDWDLDVWVEPDRAWRWKDEHEFTERLAYGADYWVEDEAQVRAAGEDVVKRVEAGEFPFDGTWTEYRPDPGWTAPSSVLPAGWDSPRAW